MRIRCECCGPANVTEPELGVVYPAISRARVLFPAPDPPMTAVSVPGRAVSEMLSSSCLPLSTTYLTSRTSRPPVRVAASRPGPECRCADQVDVADGDHVVFGQDRRPDPGAVDERSVDAGVADLGAQRRRCQDGVLTRGQDSETTMSFSAARPIVDGAGRPRG